MPGASVSIFSFYFFYFLVYSIFCESLFIIWLSSVKKMHWSDFWEITSMKFLAKLFIWSIFLHFQNLSLLFFKIFALPKWSWNSTKLSIKFHTYISLKRQKKKRLLKRLPLQSKTLTKSSFIIIRSINTLNL